MTRSRRAGALLWGMSLLAASLLMAPALGKEKIKLMYLESSEEVRAAVLINRLDVPLEVHRIGIFRVGKSQYGVVRFGVGFPAAPSFADKHRIGATTAMLSDRIFGEVPDLVRIDFEGVSQRETKAQKPEVLFSCSVDRTTWKTIPKTLVPLARVEMAGVLFFDPRIAQGQPMAPKAPSKRPGKKKPGKAKKTAKPGTRA